MMIMPQWLNLELETKVRKVLYCNLSLDEYSEQARENKTKHREQESITSELSIIFV